MFSIYAARILAFNYAILKTLTLLKEENNIIFNEFAETAYTPDIKQYTKGYEIEIEGRKEIITGFCTEIINRPIDILNRKLHYYIDKYNTFYRKVFKSSYYTYVKPKDLQGIYSNAIYILVKESIFIESKLYNRDEELSKVKLVFDMFNGYLVYTSLNFNQTINMYLCTYCFKLPKNFISLEDGRKLTISDVYGVLACLLVSDFLYMN